jgi:hypothetical protein
MSRFLMAILLAMSAQLAFAQESAVADAKPASDQPAAKADAAVTASAAKPAEREFKPPPGFYTKKRGALKVYCKKDSEIGSRFVTEKCLTEEQMHDYLLALEIQKQDVDRIRSTCGTAGACGAQ